MPTESRPRITPEEYLAHERRSDSKSEYRNGEILAMTGSNRKHNRIVLNAALALYPHVRARGFEVFANDMRVRVPGVDLYTYPDVVLVSGEPRFEDAEQDTLLNPVLVVEVLSPPTVDYDRGTKFTYYRMLPSFVEYLVVAQDKVHVEHWVREAGRWVLTETEDPAALLELPSVGCSLALASVYDRVFP